MSDADMERERLGELVERFAGRRLAVLGDLVVDEFVHGDIARVSREAPVLILDHRDTVVVPGGGANTVANLRALGSDPRTAGVIGRGATGDRLLASLQERDIRVNGIVRDARYVTPAKSRIVAGGIHTRRQQIVRLDRGAPFAELSARLCERLVGKLAAEIERAEGLLVADYGYGAATPAIVDAALRKAGKGREKGRATGFPIVVDSRARILDYRTATACTPNQEEVELAVGSEPLHSDEAMTAAGRRLLQRSRYQAVLMTRGAKGMCLFERRRRPLEIPAFGSDEVADVTGAGDTVTAVFALALLAGGSHAEAAALANVAAGLVVMKAGTATIGPAELSHALREEPV